MVLASALYSFNLLAPDYEVQQQLGMIYAVDAYYHIL